MTSALISVIIPSYNRLDLLKRAIDSVLAQTYPALELIVVDDGSRDGTAAMVQRDYPTVCLLQQPNSGVSRARNLGIVHAQGEWIALLDSDDAWYPLKLTAQMEAIQQQDKCWICHTDEVWLQAGVWRNPMQKHQKLGGWIFPECLALCRISPSSVLIHRSVFATLGMFDTNLPACEDYELWLRISANYPVLYVDEKLTVKHGGHPRQLSLRYYGMDRFRIYALHKLLTRYKLPPQYRQMAYAMLQKKITIYQQGAHKRGKKHTAGYYQRLLKKLSHQCALRPIEL